MRQTTLTFPLAEVLGVGIAVIEPDGRQAYVNPAFARMVGWPVEELIGATPPFVYWPPEECARIEQAFRDTIQDQLPGAGFELKFQRKSGERFDVLLSVARAPAQVNGWVAAVTDISTQKATESVLRDREQHLNLALSAGKLGSWEYEIATGLVTWSPVLERIHGLEPGTFGGTFEDYKSDIHPDDVDYVLSTIAKSSHGDIPHHLEYRIIWPDGQLRWLYASGQLFRDADGNPVRMLGVCSDVTERKMAEQLVEKARAEAEAANRAKSEFLAAMSHELRTPLNAIGGYLDLLDLGIHGPVTEQQRAAFQHIKRNQGHLLGVITDLLNFAQLEAGRMKYDLELFDLAACMRDMEPLLAPHAAARAIEFTLTTECAGVRALVDQDRLYQIVLNLVSNAAKFTEPGGRIHVRCGSSQTNVWIEVSDTGRGIPAEKLESIFEPFVQIDRKNTNVIEKGVGLGLAISRDLARGMDGDLTVRSEPGAGSTFRLSFPRR